MARTITAKGGPLDGRKYTIPDRLASFRHADGSYKVTQKTATWHPGTDTPDAPPAA